MSQAHKACEENEGSVANVVHKGCKGCKVLKVQ